VDVNPTFHIQIFSFLFDYKIANSDVQKDYMTTKKVQLQHQQILTTVNVRSEKIIIPQAA
jgi:hypothetical protein